MRLLFCTVGLEGHFRPMLPLAHALAAAGHDIAFATAAAMESAVSAEGFATLPAGLSSAEAAIRNVAHSAELAALPPERRRVVGFPRRFATIQAPAKLPALIEIGRSWRPDALIHESGDLAAPLVASMLDLPSVNHSFGPMVPLGVLEAAASAIAPLWREHGVEPQPYAGSFRGSVRGHLPTAACPGAAASDRIAIRPATPSPRPADRSRPSSDDHWST